MILSVVIPTCNRPDTLAAALERLAPGAQTLAAADYEVIVTDDSRSTATETLVRTRFPWARWTRGPQRGPAANRNHGARLAGCAWLAFTDDDCLPDAGWLSAFATETGESTIAALEGRTWCGERNMGSLRFAPCNESGGRLWSCNFAIRAETFRALSGFDEGFPFAHLEDVDFHHRLKAAGHGVRFVPAAAVEHPPRALGPVWRSALAHESSFYFARKHRLPLSRAGMSPGFFLRARLKQWAGSRNASETARFLGRWIAETGVIALLTPVWLWRHRRR
ncbi:MAG: glycosyltransferase family 2 protein [Opitutae bacterium]|nr:glycosyltransferase family 2 protein [Opitutae bacterium]